MSVLSSNDRNKRTPMESSPSQHHAVKVDAVKSPSGPVVFFVALPQLAIYAGLVNPCLTSATQAADSAPRRTTYSVSWVKERCSVCFRCAFRVNKTVKFQTLGGCQPVLLLLLSRLSTQ